MYTCPRCRKFSSIGPGTCWKCGARLENQDPPVTQVVTLRVRPRILFVGVIDGGPELNFIRHMRLGACIAHFTTYGAASEGLRRLHGTSYLSAEIVVEDNIDATALGMHYPVQRFETIVWIGPTDDRHLPNTALLVQQFVASAGTILNPRGVVFVVQDIKSPNFRGILAIPGAHFCCEINLAGRTKTQHSEKMKRMEDRLDQLIAFTFHNGVVVSINDVGNARFLNIFTMIMSTAARNYNLPENMKKYNQNFLTKQKLASLIFGFANNMIEPPPPRLRITLVPEAKPSIYKCPRCKNFASSGPGQCWKCGTELVGEP